MFIHVPNIVKVSSPGSMVSLESSQMTALENGITIRAAIPGSRMTYLLSL